MGYPCKVNADIIAFPESQLCPECGEGRLRGSAMSSKSIQVGPHWRFSQKKCDQCGYTARVPSRYFGVEEADAQ